MTSTLGMAGFRLLRHARSRIGAAQMLLAGHMALAMVMILVLRPSATLLPYARAMGVARSFGFMNASLPWYSRREVQQMGLAFPEKATRDAARLTARNLARPLCDSVVLRRALSGKADTSRWCIEQRAVADVERLRASGESSILATGHFSRQAFMALGDQKVLPHRMTSVSLPPTVLGLHPRSWWLRYHYGQILDYSRFSRPEIEFVYPDRPGTYRRLVEALGQANRVVITHAYAPISGRADGYCRPFSGLDFLGTRRLDDRNERWVG